MENFPCELFVNYPQNETVSNTDTLYPHGKFCEETWKARQIVAKRMAKMRGTRAEA